MYWTILEAVAAEVGLVPVKDWGRSAELTSSFEAVSTACSRPLIVHSQGSCFLRMVEHALQQCFERTPHVRFCC